MFWNVFSLLLSSTKQHVQRAISTDPVPSASATSHGLGAESSVSDLYTSTVTSDVFVT